MASRELSTPLLSRHWIEIYKTYVLLLVTIVDLSWDQGQKAIESLCRLAESLLQFCLSAFFSFFSEAIIGRPGNFERGKHRPASRSRTFLFVFKPGRLCLFGKLIFEEAADREKRRLEILRLARVGLRM